MQLLDATLAFALTMAALATVVTVIMEACLRVARMRKKLYRGDETGHRLGVGPRLGALGSDRDNILILIDLSYKNS